MTSDMPAISEIDFETGITSLNFDQIFAWGFRSGERGTHTSRTIMLDELSQLLEAVPGQASRADYAEAVMQDNCLGKKTAATRKLSLQRLTELYALDERSSLFCFLKELWGRHHSSRPLLAVLLALARDPLLRATANAVLRTPIGHEFARQSMKDGVQAVVGDRLNEATLDKVVRNASSSWTQSGHLRGRGRKIRQCVHPTPAATAYALLLGFAVGCRGYRLFETPWVAILDATVDELLDLAVDAKRLGLIDFKQSGTIIDVSFPTLSSDKGGY